MLDRPYVRTHITACIAVICIAVRDRSGLTTNIAACIAVVCIGVHLSSVMPTGVTSLVIAIVVTVAIVDAGTAVVIMPYGIFKVRIFSFHLEDISVIFAAAIPYIRYFCASAKCSITDIGITATDGHSGQVVAIGECRITNSGDTVRDGHRGQAGTPIKRLIAYGGDAVRDGYRG